ncbi:hypothetical protein GOBAR_AA32992 [Gossypium barbadense]|uniref:Methyltransferase domain-containing protein n=1 Tax=Gossypium barbadense TaxID=3634 RepID=A0A2P5W9B9_GOSBA|nr:hypothetical protein GOBAR_AA32992 [Gossypium barbadense]
MDTAQNPDSDHKKTDLPSSASVYLDPNYWNQRFSNEEHYEWFKDYSHFRHLMQSHIKPNSSVLELGCGNSQLCEELYKDGITDITCIDLSSVAVERMKERLLSKGYEEIKVLEADMLDLPFSNECFDVVIEKGTMDVLFVDSGDPWNPQPATISKVMAMLEGVHKVLKPNGIFISITFGQGRRSLDDEDSIEKIQMPSISLYHEELEGEDYIFRTNIEELNRFKLSGTVADNFESDWLFNLSIVNFIDSDLV